MSKIFTKGVRTYDFIIVFKKDVDIEKCHRIIKETFINQFSNDCINCSWKIEEMENRKTIKGDFESLGDIQHRLHIRFRNHVCCESPILTTRIIRTSTRKKTH